MQPKERCFRIPARYAAFSSGLFGSALTFWIAEPPASLSDILPNVETTEVVQKKISLGADDVSLLSTLKEFYNISHDYEVVSLVIAHAVSNNPLFAA